MEYTTMSIASIGAPTMPNNGRKESKVVHFDKPASNDVSDIPGAKPELKSYKYSNKPQVTLADTDAGSRPKVLAYERQNAPDLTLCVDDIPGTRYAIKDRFLQSKRHVNPLCPEYDLPSSVEVAPIVQPFRRDSMNISDIEGTKPKPPKQYKTRDTFGVDDIDGTKPGWKSASYKQKVVAEREINNVEDICKRTHRYIDRTNRISNSLDPEYVVAGMVLKDDSYSKPKPSKKEIKDNHLMQTADIEGATPAWKFRNRTETRNINYTLDIVGAQADSILKGIKTDRIACPLNPYYQSLDNGEPILPLNAPLIPKELVKFACLKPEISHAKLPVPPKSNNSHPNHNPIASNNNNNNNNTNHNSYNSSSVSYAQKIESENQDKDKLLRNQNSSMAPLDFSQLKGYELPNISALNLNGLSNENINNSNYNDNDDNNSNNNNIYNGNKPLSSSGSRNRVNHPQFGHPVVLTSNSQVDKMSGGSGGGAIKKVHIPVSPMASARSQTNTPRNSTAKPTVSAMVTPREKKASQQLKAEIDAVRQLH